MTIHSKPAREAAPRPAVLLAIDEAAAFLLAMGAFAMSTLVGDIAAPFGFLGLGIGWFLILKRETTPIRVLTALALSAACLLLRIGPSL